MSMELIRKAADPYSKKDVPGFQIGDTVNVSVRIVEGEKERTQVFSGVVIARRGHGMGEMFTVRRIVNNEGVERTFPVHSPKVSGIEVLRHGRVRRGKLYYLQQRVGKATRLKEVKRGTAVAVAEVVPPAEEAPSGAPDAEA